MKIMDILVNDAVILNLGAGSKREVLAEMAGALAKVEPQIEGDRLLEVLLEREALQSTGIGDGVAIPHGKMAGLDRLVASFARSSEGVDFESIDRRPTHHFFLLVVPEHSGGQYLKALARIGGVGQKKLDRFGQIFLAVLDEHRGSAQHTASEPTLPR